MSRLAIDTKCVKDLFKSNFEIPSYQRQYAWEERECLQLWDDLFSFAFPDNDSTNFNQNSDEYFLGPIVTFPNGKKQEVIDGHQRLVTLTLLLRALYDYCSKEDSKLASTACQNIEQCIWTTNEAGEPDINSSKLDIMVATDELKQEFRDILQTGKAPSYLKSCYAENYRFFQRQIQDILLLIEYKEIKGDLALLPIRIMNNCILLPIEADSQDSALQIFSTLNDRGKPLSDSDIFKAQLYEYYNNQKPSRKNEFILKWKELEKICIEIFPASKGKISMDEAFIRYMYYERAKQGKKNSTVEAVRKFYERDSYALLKNGETFESIINLVNFWYSVSMQDQERFSQRVLKKFFILNYAPNGMWTYITSVYYLVNKDHDGMLDDEKFYNFLNKITAFIMGFSLMGKFVSDFRAPLYAEMLNVVNGSEIEFQRDKFDLERLKNAFLHYEFTQKKVLTKMMLVWWAFLNDEQQIIKLSQKLEVNYIYPEERLGSLVKLFKKLGNISLLPNVKVRLNRVSDKLKSWYHGDIREEVKIQELYDRPFAKFTKEDIVRRDDLMLQKFIDYLKKNDLIK